MKNVPIRATAEGMPTISRRAFLRSTAGASVLGGACVMHVPAEAASPALLALIAEHDRATREWLECLSAESAIEEVHLAAIAAMRADGSSRSHVEEARASLKAEPEAIAAENAVEEASGVERAALFAIFTYPVATPADLRAKLEHLLAMPDRDNAFGMIDDPATTLMRSIMGGGLV